MDKNELQEERRSIERSGIAALSDLGNTLYRDLFVMLEHEQAGFLANERSFISPEYPWPRDPLHNWSRVWEYPYAFYHLEKWKKQLTGIPLPRIVDIGSGVTFFPFTIARMGCRVTCVDNDPIVAHDLERAIHCTPCGTGSVEQVFADGAALPIKNEEIDAVYCISVLEHVPSPDTVLKELARILKPGGMLILTIDLDMRGDAEIGVERYRSLTTLIHDLFTHVYDVVTVHPLDMLLSSRGPYKIQNRGLLERTKILLKQRVLRTLPIGQGAPALSFDLAVTGMCLRRR